MIKTLRNIIKQDKEEFFVPKGVQDCMAVYGVYDDGIMRLSKFPKGGLHKYSKTYIFTDINFEVADENDKKEMIKEYSELLNSFDPGVTTKITINNRKVNRDTIKKSVSIPYQDDNSNFYRDEYNQMLVGKATSDDSIIQEKYITISVFKKNVNDARNYFNRISLEFKVHFNALGSKLEELNSKEKLKVFHNFFRKGEEYNFDFDLKETIKSGQNFKDYICPDTFEFETDYFKMGERYGRVLFLREFATYIKDDLVSKLTGLKFNMMMSIDVVSIPTDEAVREVESKLLGVETNISSWQRKQNQNNNFSAMVPYDLEIQRSETKEYLDDITTRDQRMMEAIITIVHTADTKEQLDSDTEALMSVARERMSRLSILKWQQMDGLNTVLPYGNRKIDCFRTLTTESLAFFIPFKVQDIMDEGGIYIGENAISGNLLMCNKANLMNPNAFLLGVPGSGKSFSAKELIIFLALATKDDILVCDPEGEVRQEVA